MVNNLGWEVIKEFYQKEFGIEGWVVEMYANMDILILCASGASNETIEKFLELPVEDVSRVIRDAYDFEGWACDLPINPYQMFISYNGQVSSVQHFTDFVNTVDTELSKYGGIYPKTTEKMFYICETMYDIERKIKDEWI